MEHKYILRLVLAALIYGSFIVSSLADPIDVVITSRPPYYVVDENGEVSGIVASPAAKVFKMAGVDVRWVITSFKRQLKMIENNKKQTCGIGWFKNSEREKFAKFTKYIYQNRPFIALSRADNDAVKAHRNMRSLLNDQSLKMGKKFSFSYGTSVDGLIDELTPVSITTTQSIVGMARMLIGQRFDYMIVSPEEATHLFNLLGTDSEDLAMIKLVDLPPGNKRYILCSQSVDDEIIDRLNTAILKTAR